MRFFNLENIPKGYLKSCFLPRPIAWISSLSKEGKVNLAPFSFYNLVSDSPPMIIFSTTGQHIESGKKDTLLNIEDTKKFTINVPSYRHAKKLNITSSMVNRDINEFELAEIDYLISKTNGIPFVKDISIRIECEYYKSISLPKASDDLINIMVIGYVTGIGVNDDIIKNGRIDVDSLKPISRLGYNDYAFIDHSNIFEIVR